MSDTAPEFDAVVNEDGSLTVSPEQAARLGLEPGSHLRLVPAPRRRSIAEILDEQAKWQEQRGIEFTEEEAERLAVEVSRDIRKRLSDQARKGA